MSRLFALVTIVFLSAPLADPLTPSESVQEKVCIPFIGCFNV